MKPKGRGGAGRGQGRKSKDHENRIRDLSINSLTEVFGSEAAAIVHLSKEAQQGGREGFPYFKLLLEYAYGKPKDNLDITSGNEKIEGFKLSSLTEKELSVILKLHAGQHTDSDEERD